MVADDNEAFRRLVRRLLVERDDWIICGEAANGTEAIEKAKRMRPNVVILDIRMPGMNGIEAPGELLGRARTRQYSS